MFAGIAALSLFAAVCLVALICAAAASKSISRSKHQCYGVSTYVQFVHDKDDLNRFGYPQLLLRKFGHASSFGLSFHQLSLVGGTVALFGWAISEGGLAVIGWGWPIIGLFGIAAGAAMAELCSAFPTAGGPYHWALALGGARWSWLAGWLYVAGNAAFLAFTNYTGARVLSSYAANQFGYANESWMCMLIMLVMYAMQWRVNRIRQHRFSAMQTIGIWLVAVIAFGAIARIMWLSWPGVLPAEALFGFGGQTVGSADFLTESSSSSPIGWLAGVLLLQRMFIGSEGAAASAEETIDPRVRSAWSMYLAPVYVYIIGFVMLAIVALNIPIAQGDSGVLGIGLTTLAHAWKAGEPIIIVAVFLAIGWSGVQGMNALSRILFAMSRDGALPDKMRWSRVSVRTGKPNSAVTAAAIISAGVGMSYAAWNGASAIGIPLAAFAATASQLGCAIPLGLRLLSARQRKELQEAPWSLGRLGTPIRWIAWIGMISMAVGATAVLSLSAGLAAIGIGIIAWGAAVWRGARFEKQLRKLFKRTRQELQRIERKFGPLYLDGK
ncbi:amino acid permease-associated region [Paenibacillus curdlanolyticus YK9]|uniref:Amino acid permease-associated region n=1 Tax=Paenibacillus curdlanolyticus YK9 TaxID=717606 RepID=E0I581_9BACL|nr:amino acid permease [Paenibacillus curdlanolyticus]EFM12123.1 amino acid permease-associated region [Paenibacillus curdlanolyticus YK9]